ncbi:hypothetical protein DFH09DRAFT_911755 [Mycena vulgaris]|nr:hypothetical protein DFH09DRAFT_911755 [Mycena vulgaris]
MLKCAARGHAANGIAGMRAGECVLLCPACPQPRKNLLHDRDRKTAPQEKHFLYMLFLVINTNFRMKQKHISSEEEDPSLGDGFVFFSKVDEYMASEKSTCVAHNTVDQLDCVAHRTASSWIGIANCARHNMKLLNSVADLQKGERYINMDYIVWKSLAGYNNIVQLFISYDIICQWHKNVW